MTVGGFFYFMKFYHGTSKDNWEKIKQEGVLWGGCTFHATNGRSGYRYTYLTPHIEVAEAYGDVILEVEYSPKGVSIGKDNYYFEHEIPEEERAHGATCWQFSVFIPIEINKVKQIKKPNK